MKENMSSRLVSIRRHIHSNPELGGQEFATTAFIKKVLEGAGVKTRRPTKTGLIGVIYGTKIGGPKIIRTIALRADIDALPVVEKTGKSYASKKTGVMHACGHDANTTIVLGAALSLAQRKDEFAGCVKFIFQPKEETSEGAAGMIKAGALKSPAVDAIVGVHVNPWLRSGTIGFKYGPMMAAVDKFEIEVIGDGGHGAYPHLGKDAVVIAAQIVTALQTIVSREVDPVKPAVLTIGAIEGGERFNIICGRVKMVGTVRTLEQGLRKKIESSMRNKISCITKSYGAGYRFKYESLGVPLINSTSVLEILKKTAADLLGSSKVKILSEPSMGGEDFSEYLKYVRGCFVYIGTGLRKPYPWHHEKFDIDERSLSNGAQFLSEAAIRYLNKAN